MERLRTVRGGPALRYQAQLSQREPGWELRRLTKDGEPVGEMIVLYTAEQVTAFVLLREVPAKRYWDQLDSWVLKQLDCSTRSFVVDYYQARYVTGVAGPPEDDPDDDEAGESA